LEQGVGKWECDKKSSVRVFRTAEALRERLCPEGFLSGEPGKAAIEDLQGIREVMAYNEVDCLGFEVNCFCSEGE
jgi:hypothetical protein